MKPEKFRAPFAITFSPAQKTGIMGESSGDSSGPVVDVFGELQAFVRDRIRNGEAEHFGDFGVELEPAAWADTLAWMSPRSQFRGSALPGDECELCGLSIRRVGEIPGLPPGGQGYSLVNLRMAREVCEMYQVAFVQNAANRETVVTWRGLPVDVRAAHRVADRWGVLPAPIVPPPRRREDSLLPRYGDGSAGKVSLKMTITPTGPSVDKVAEELGKKIRREAAKKLDVRIGALQLLANLPHPRMAPGSIQRAQAWLSGRECRPHVAIDAGIKRQRFELLRRDLEALADGWKVARPVTDAIIDYDGRPAMFIEWSGFEEFVVLDWANEDLDQARLVVSTLLAAHFLASYLPT